MPAYTGRELIGLIEAAFIHRNKPMLLSTSTSLSPDELDEINQFSDKLWSELTIEDVRNCGDALFHFTGETFCYFLPGFLITTVRESNTELMAIENILSSLDRSPIVEYWDAYFLSRWPLLTVDELSAIQNWLLWLVATNSEYAGIPVNRSFDTLELLKTQQIPINCSQP